MKSELEILEERIAALKAMQSRCTHEWLKPEEDTFKQPVYEDCWIGENVFLVPSENYEYIPCQSMLCQKCGKKEYLFTNNKVTEEPTSQIKL